MKSVEPRDGVRGTAVLPEADKPAAVLPLRALPLLQQIGVRKRPERRKQNFNLLLRCRPRKGADKEVVPPAPTTLAWGGQNGAGRRTVVRRERCCSLGSSNGSSSLHSQPSAGDRCGRGGVLHGHHCGEKVALKNPLKTKEKRAKKKTVLDIGN